MEEPAQNLDSTDQGGSASRGSALPVPTEPPKSQTKRRKVPLACTSCRDRKTRCDGARPFCKSCQKRGIDSTCLYEESSLRTQRYDGLQSHHGMRSARMLTVETDSYGRWKKGFGNSRSQRPPHHGNGRTSCKRCLEVLRPRRGRSRLCNFSQRSRRPQLEIVSCSCTQTIKRLTRIRFGWIPPSSVRNDFVREHWSDRFRAADGLPGPHHKRRRFVSDTIR